MKVRVSQDRFGLEECYSFFKHFETIMGDSLFNFSFSPRVTSGRFFDIAQRRGYLDKTYINKLREFYGDGFVGISVKKAMDLGELEKFLKERESINGGVDDIHDFILFIYSEALQEDDEIKYLIDNLVNIANRAGEDIEDFELVYPKRDIRNKHLSYYNQQTIQEALAAMREFDNNEITQRMISILEKIFLD